MTYLFQVSIGPIQAFIASARRTKDLAFGSWLLSELAKAAAAKIVELNGLESLIFPAPGNTENLKFGSPLNVANKIVALIETVTPETMGKEVKAAIDARLHEIKEIAYRDMGSLGKDGSGRDAADKQIDDLVECFWVAVRYDEPHDYVVARRKVEALMAARKNTRDFSKVKWGSSQFKSSLDGQLESVIPDWRYPDRKKDSEKEIKQKETYLYERYNVGPAEYLSGVDLLKRRGVVQIEEELTKSELPETERFSFPSVPSTSHIATLPFLKRLEYARTVQAKWNEYITLLKNIAISPKLEQIPSSFSAHSVIGRYEGSLFFEERLVDVIDMPSADKTKVQDVKKALRAFYAAVDEELGKARPFPYYAILLADGDGMGKVIDNQKDPDDHRKLSQTLDGFAGSVRGIVETYEGVLVYAGGDDVLAFVPLHTLLACARALSGQFKNALNDFSDQSGHKSTLSVGIAIVHHLESLHDALNLARDAEKKAKGVKDKNALAIIVSKRGGADYTVSGQWGQIDASVEQLTGFADPIPSGMAYELRDLALRLALPKEHSEFSTMQAVLQADAKRILERKLSYLSKEKRAEIMGVLEPKLGISNGKLDAGKAANIHLEALTNELLLAQLLADAKKLTELKEGAKA